jgi:hypothetical protein
MGMSRVSASHAKKPVLQSLKLAQKTLCQLCTARPTPMFHAKHKICERDCALMPLLSADKLYQPLMASSKKIMSMTFDRLFIML